MPKPARSTLLAQRQAIAERRAKLLAEFEAEDRELREKQLDRIRDHAAKLALFELDDDAVKVALTELAERSKDPTQVERWRRQAVQNKPRLPKKTPAPEPSFDQIAAE